MVKIEIEISKRRKDSILKNLTDGYGQLYNKKEKWKESNFKKSVKNSKWEIQIKNFNSEKPKECLEKDVNELNMLNIPIIDKKEYEIITYLNKIYKITAQDAQIIYHAFDGDISYKKLGKLYQNFKKDYNPIEIAVVLQLFKDDIDKVRYAIAANMTKGKKETLENTVLKVKEEKGLDEYSILIKKLIKEEGLKEIDELDEMTNGRVSEDGEKFMRYFDREGRELEKLINKYKGMNLKKALEHAGMHITH